MNIKSKYQCPACESTYDSEYLATRCCDAREVYVCGGCGKTFHKFDKDEAEGCCVYTQLHDFGDPAPTCFFCGERATGADIHDSIMVGTFVRCRKHILAVAPELLTADAIIRAA